MVDKIIESLHTNPSVEYTYSYGPVEIQTSSMSKTVSEVRKKVAPLRFKLAAREISKELKLEPEQKILELGSGLGLLGKAIKEEINGDIKYAGVELAFKSAQKSKEKGLLETQADIVNLPFANNSFDAIVSTDVLEHIPNTSKVVEEIERVLKPDGKAFIVIADPSEGRFSKVKDHIDRDENKSNLKYWENLFEEKKLQVLSDESEKYRNRDWRKIFNLPFLVKLKEKPGFACAFNPVNRPGTYILEKPKR